MALSGLRNFENRLSIIQKYNMELNLRLGFCPPLLTGGVKKSAVILKQLIDAYGPKVGPPIMYSARLSENHRHRKKPSLSQTQTAAGPVTTAVLPCGC